MTTPSSDGDSELEFYRSLAERRGEVIRALHEFNYWHESTVARGEVASGLEESVAMWRERCLAAEARLTQSVGPAVRGGPAGTAAGAIRRALRVVRALAARMPRKAPLA